MLHSRYRGGCQKKPELKQSVVRVQSVIGKCSQELKSVHSYPTSTLELVLTTYSLCLSCADSRVLLKTWDTKYFLVLPFQTSAESLCIQVYLGEMHSLLQTAASCPPLHPGCSLWIWRKVWWKVWALISFSSTLARVQLHPVFAMEAGFWTFDVHHNAGRLLLFLSSLRDRWDEGWVSIWVNQKITALTWRQPRQKGAKLGFCVYLSCGMLGALQPGGSWHKVHRDYKSENEARFTSPLFCATGGRRQGQGVLTVRVSYTTSLTQYLSVVIPCQRLSRGATSDEYNMVTDCAGL